MAVRQLYYPSNGILSMAATSALCLVLGSVAIEKFPSSEPTNKYWASGTVNQYNTD
jgi:hypothetical protein